MPHPEMQTSEPPMSVFLLMKYARRQKILSRKRKGEWIYPVQTLLLLSAAVSARKKICRWFRI